MTEAGPRPDDGGKRPARRRAREAVLQALYLCDMAGCGLEEGLEQVRDHFMLDRRAREYAASLVRGLAPRLAEVDGRIAAQAENWRLERMGAVDRNILRLAAYELCFCPEVPAAVAINEALEIARRFSTDDAVSFINGILDSLRRKIGRDDS